MRVLAARATELEREFPYGVVRQLLEPALAAADGPSRAALLDGPAGGSRPVFGSGALADAPYDDLSFSVLYGLHWLAVNVSEEAPLLLAVDDAHWADVPSVQFLRFMATRLEGLPILIAIGTRPVDAASPLATLSSDPGTVVLRPQPLGPGSTARLLEAALGSPPDDRFAAACHRLAGGNPFLLSELSRKLADDEVQPVAANVATLEGLVPDTILRTVLQRLGSLEPPAQRLARAVAVLGDGCEQQHAAALAGLEHHDAARAADALRAAQILDPESEPRFVHPLVRNAIYADLPAGARSREHERAAELLAAAGLPAERLAGHLLAMDGRGDGRVAEVLGCAARSALDRGAPDSAVAYLSRALREPAPAALRPELLELLNRAAMRVADVNALAPFEDEALAALTADPETLVRAAEGLSKYLIASGRLAEGLRILKQGIAAADQAGDLAAAVEYEAQLTVFADFWPAEEAARLARYEDRLVDETPEKRLLLGLRAWWSHCSGGTAADAVELAKRALPARSWAGGDPDPVWWGQIVLVLVRADELDAAEEAVEARIEREAERGSVASLMSGWYMRGVVALRRGDLQRAEDDARHLIEVDGPRYTGFFRIVQQLFSSLFIDVMVQRDELDAAERELAARGIDRELGDTYWIWPVLFSRGRLRLAQGRARESAADLLELRGRLGEWGQPAAPGMMAAAHAARALAALGDLEQARVLADEQLASARRWGARSGIAEALATLGFVVGGERGAELLREAVDLLESAPTRLLHAATLADLGALLRRERRPAEAREPLREALDVARRCGGVAVARRAAHELEAAGEKVQRHTPIGVDTLTASERRVAGMAARGMTNREIAAALYITVKTVESHLSAAYDKLGVRARTELQQALEPSPLPAAS